MIELKDEGNKRVTWRLDDGVNVKLDRIAKSANLTKEEVANIILDASEWEGVKPHISRYRQEKLKAAERKKRAAQTVSNLDPALVEKLANFSPEEIAELLSKN